MADIRINSLPTTASASSSDDFLALDGATNGTRKLNAYSPTFGGNVTASGNLTVSGVTTSAGISNSGALTFTAAIGQVAGSIAKNATYGLTYYGVTGSSNDNTMLNASGAVVLSNPAGTTNATLSGNLTVSGTDYNYVGGNKFFRGFTNYNVLYTGATELSINNQADGANLASFKNNGNFLIGGTTDNGNKLQVSGTFSAITGDGTGAKISYVQGGTTAGDYGIFNIQNGGTVRGRLVADASYADFRLDTGGSASGGFVFKTGASYTTALTLDSSQNATFAGKITANGAGSTFKGTATNDSAAAGYVGELISATDNTGVSLTTGTRADVVSISLTAGDWDVTGYVGYLPSGGASSTYQEGSISATSATIGAAGARTLLKMTTTAQVEFPLPTVRVSLSATTTYYLVTNNDFTGGTMKGTGIIRARRVR